MNPFGVRRDNLGELIGSEKLARELIAAGWLKPMIQEPRLTLFDVDDVRDAFKRMKGGRPPRQTSKEKAE